MFPQALWHAAADEVFEKIYLPAAANAQEDVGKSKYIHQHII